MIVGVTRSSCLAEGHLTIEKAFGLGPGFCLTGCVAQAGTQAPAAGPLPEPLLLAFPRVIDLSCLPPTLLRSPALGTFSASFTSSVSFHPSNNPLGEESSISQMWKLMLEREDILYSKSRIQSESVFGCPASRFFPWFPPLQRCHVCFFPPAS